MFWGDLCAVFNGCSTALSVYEGTFDYPLLNCATQVELPMEIVYTKTAGRALAEVVVR